MSKVLVDRELLPCPFCGQQDAFVEQLDSDASVVICQGMVDEHSACLARGPVGVQQSDLEDQPGKDAAIAAWNDRAQPAEAEGVKTWRERIVAAHPKSEPGYWPDALLVEHMQPEIEELRAAMSAVTANLERVEALRDSLANMSDRVISERNQLRAEAEALRVALLGIASVNPAERGIEWAKAYASDGLSGTGSELYIRWLETLKEAEALRKDAERYRWLRGRLPGSAYRIAGVIYSEGGDGVDAAVDAAMAAKEA